LRGLLGGWGCEGNEGNQEFLKGFHQKDESLFVWITKIFSQTGTIHLHLWQIKLEPQKISKRTRP